MKYPCENCKLRAAYDKNPKSLIGRFWRSCSGKRPEVERFNEHHPDPHMPEQFDQEDGLFKFEKRMKKI